MLKEIFESTVLTDDNKKLIEEAVNVKIQEAVEAERVKHAQQVEKIKSEMSKAQVDMIEEAITDELSAIAEEVVQARTLEVRYAKKLEESMESYDKKQKKLLTKQVTEALRYELSELKEDIETAKKAHFAQELVKNFQGVYENLFGGYDGNIHAQLEEAKQELDRLKREQKMNELLSGLSESKRSVAKTILENVATDKLEARFRSISRVLLSESSNPVKQKTSKAKKVPSQKIVVESDQYSAELVNKSILRAIGK